MRFQQRDGEILSTIQEYDGVLAQRHLRARFWPDTSLRAMQKRISELVQEGYVARPTVDQSRTQPVPEPVYWLGWKGIMWVAGQRNVQVSAPANQGENQIRKLAKALRDGGVDWVREPRWLQLPHDLKVVDFRLSVERAVAAIPSLVLEQWIHEGAFRRDGDVIQYRGTTTSGRVSARRKRVYPDSYFVLMNRQRASEGHLARVRLLLELDNSSYTNERFGREKVVPGLVYLTRPEYKARFGANSGRWLVATTGRVRMRNLMRQTRAAVGAGAEVFLFTTFDRIGGANVLTSPIWWMAGRAEPMSILDNC